MKLMAIVLVGLMVCSCLAAPRRALMGEMLEKERGSIEHAGVASVGNVKEEQGFVYPDGSIDNHHNIPRQYYNQRGSSSSNGDNSDNGDNNDNGTG